MRAVFLYEIAFKYKCFNLGAADDIFKPCNMRHHLLYLGRFLVPCLEILMDPVVEVDRFADIYNVIPGIVHQIHSWHVGKLLKFFFKIKHICHLKI